MKKYIHLLKAIVLEKQNEDGSFRVHEITNEETDVFPLRFFAIPRKGDVFYLEETYDEVLLVQFEVAKKTGRGPSFSQREQYSLKK